MGCLKRHKYLLQPAKVNEFLQVEDGTLIQKSGGVLNNKHLLANQLKLSIFYSNWEIQGCLRWHKFTLKNQARQRGHSRKSWRMQILPHFFSKWARQLIFEYVGYFLLLTDQKNFQICLSTATLLFRLWRVLPKLHRFVNECQHCRISVIFYLVSWFMTMKESTLQTDDKKKFRSIRAR